MQRYMWLLEVRPGYEDEYKRRHDEIWPEMLADLTKAGLSNYSIFRHGQNLYGYFETENLEKAKKHLAKSKVNARWQKWMGPIMRVEIDPTTNFPYLLPMQFHMD